MAFEDIPSEDVEIEVGTAPDATPAGPTFEEVMAEKTANAARIQALEAEAANLKTQQTVSQMGELLQRQQQAEAQRREDEARRNQAPLPAQNMTADELAAWETRFLADPKNAMVEFENRLMQHKVLPLMQGMYAEIQEVKTSSAKQTILADPISKDIYSKYQSEVEATMKTINPNQGNPFTVAMDIVKSRHLSEIIAAEVAKQTTAATTTTTTAAAKVAPSNAVPPVNGVPIDGGDVKKKVYVSPELWAQKPLGMDDRMYLEYLKSEGKVK